MARLAHIYRIRRFTSLTDFSAVQRLERVTQAFGVPIRVKVIDEEDVPSWALIALACLGSTDWESRLFKQYDHLLNPKDQP